MMLQELLILLLLLLFLIDVDECIEETDGCAQNCTNTNGSYTCTCNLGYRLGSNGYSCYGTNLFNLDVCWIHFHTVITDIDECQEGTHLCNQTCTNTIGSYICQCYDGYTLGIDRTSCVGKTVLESAFCSQV